MTASITLYGEHPSPGSEAEIRLAERLADVRKINEQEAPQKALDIRQRALHVDHIHHFPVWNRPSRITSDEADSWVGAADVRYGHLRSELENDNSELGKKIWVGIERLQLPQSSGDILTWQEEAVEDKEVLNLITKNTRGVRN